MIKGKKKLKKNACEPVDILKEKDSDPKYKTELCKTFVETNFCPYKNKCRFAHGRHELFQKSDKIYNYKKKNCKSFHNEGYCNYGSRCLFKHNDSLDKIDRNIYSSLITFREVNELLSQKRSFAKTKNKGLSSYRDDAFNLHSEDKIKFMTCKASINFLPVTTLNKFRLQEFQNIVPNASLTKNNSKEKRISSNISNYKTLYQYNEEKQEEVKTEKNVNQFYGFNSIYNLNKFEDQNINKFSNVKNSSDSSIKIPKESKETSTFDPNKNSNTYSKFSPTQDLALNSVNKIFQDYDDYKDYNECYYNLNNFKDGKENILEEVELKSSDLYGKSFQIEKKFNNYKYSVDSSSKFVSFNVINKVKLQSQNSSTSNSFRHKNEKNLLSNENYVNFNQDKNKKTDLIIASSLESRNWQTHKDSFNCNKINNYNYQKELLSFKSKIQQENDDGNTIAVNKTQNPISKYSNIFEHLNIRNEIKYIKLESEELSENIDSNKDEFEKTPQKETDYISENPIISSKSKIKRFLKGAQVIGKSEVPLRYSGFTTKEGTPIYQRSPKKRIRSISQKKFISK